MEYKNIFESEDGRRADVGIIRKNQMPEYRKRGKKMESNKELKQTVEKIAKKYAELVEKRIESIQILTGTDLKEVYDEIQMLGHIAATLERLGRMKEQS